MRIAALVASAGHAAKAERPALTGGLRRIMMKGAVRAGEEEVVRMEDGSIRHPRQSEKDRRRHDFRPAVNVIDGPAGVVLVQPALDHGSGGCVVQAGHESPAARTR